MYTDAVILENLVLNVKGFLHIIIVIIICCFMLIHMHRYLSYSNGVLSSYEK